MEKQAYGCNYEAPKNYRIGMFAQMNRITVKTLRYYDDIGLLHPAYVDEMSGYRYYTSDQLPQLHRILALKAMDLSIIEIQAIMNGTSEAELLKKKKSDLMMQMADLHHKVACIEGYLTSDFLISDYRVVMKTLPEVIVASMRVQLSSYDELLYRMPEMGLLMEKANCTCIEPDYCFNMYHNQEYRETDIDVEMCEAITTKVECEKPLVIKTLPEVKLAACILHKGSYATLPKAYKAIVQFIEESGYEIDGLQRESYIDGIWNKDSEEEWLTEIQFPVRKIES